MYNIQQANFGHFISLSKFATTIQWLKFGRKFSVAHPGTAGIAVEHRCMTPADVSRSPAGGESGC